MSGTPKIAKLLYYPCAALLLAGSLAATVLIAKGEEWHPLSLVLLLAALAMAGQHLMVTIRGQVVTAAFVAVVLSMCLLGPAPAVACGIAPMIYNSAARRLPFADWLSNLSTYAFFPLVGALLARALIGNVHDPYNHATQGFGFALAVFVVFLASLAINFLLIAVTSRVFWGRRFGDQIVHVLVPVLPAELAAALFTTLAAVVYVRLGIAWSLGSVLALAIFQLLVVRLIRAEDVAEQLRSTVYALVSSQVGTIKAAVKFLDARDPGSERHAATVAIYARELAAEVGCSKEDQHYVHAAGLAHDIGRLAFHDHVLRAEGVVDDEDWREIRRHPIEGSSWVGHIHGYGPVADIILSHHERWDGLGYPDQFIGPEIPLLSRILAICEAFDAMTARQTYRPRMTAQDAFEQLRMGAGSQFDPDLVETFIAMRRRNGPMHLTIDDADFDAELNFERRVGLLADGDGDGDTGNGSAKRGFIPRLTKRMGS